MLLRFAPKKMFSRAGRTLTHIGGRYAPSMNLNELNWISMVSCSVLKKVVCPLAVHSSDYEDDLGGGAGVDLLCRIEEYKPANNGKKREEELACDGKYEREHEKAGDKSLEHGAGTRWAYDAETEDA
jgi:hypothetical protein